VFLSVLTVSLLSVLATGLLVRVALAQRFEAYLGSTLENVGPGRRMGRMLLGSAEQTFLADVDRAILIAAVVAVALAAAVALLIAKGLTRGLRDLTAGVRRLGSGDWSQRIDADGPLEVVELTMAFNDMADSLEKAEELRRRMVADVAHELRNPVTGLRVQLEGVAEGVVPMDQRRADNLVEDVGALSRLVEDLHQLTIADAGGLSYVHEEFDLAVMAQREVERVAGAVAPGIELRARSVGKIVVCADESRLAQVLRNLLSNAIRHTAEGIIEVRIELREGWARLVVSDEGEGIPAEALPHIFERFYRADEARGRGTGGAGVGLAIADTIVRDHGGQMFARSDGTSGAQVGFRIPLDCESARSRPGSESGQR
jgi:signal transduction histidine kinase